MLMNHNSNNINYKYMHNYKNHSNFAKQTISLPVPSKICPATPPTHRSQITIDNDDETLETPSSPNQCNPDQYHAAYKVQIHDISNFKEPKRKDISSNPSTRNYYVNQKAYSNISSPKKCTIEASRKVAQVESPIIQKVMGKLIKRHAILVGNALKVLENSSSSVPLTVINITPLYSLDVQKNTLKIQTSNGDTLIEFNSSSTNFISPLKVLFSNPTSGSKQNQPTPNQITLDEVTRTCESGDILLYESKSFSAKIQRIITRSAYGTLIIRSRRNYL